MREGLPRSANCSPLPSDPALRCSLAPREPARLVESKSRYAPSKLAHGKAAVSRRTEARRYGEWRTCLCAFRRFGILGALALDKPQRFGLPFLCYLLPVGSAVRPPAGFCF
jgi:hypothetical protein